MSSFYKWKKYWSWLFFVPCQLCLLILQHRRFLLVVRYGSVVVSLARWHLSCWQGTVVWKVWKFLLFSVVFPKENPKSFDWCLGATFYTLFESNLALTMAGSHSNKAWNFHKASLIKGKRKQTQTNFGIPWLDTTCDLLGQRVLIFVLLDSWKGRWTVFVKLKFLLFVLELLELHMGKCPKKGVSVVFGFSFDKPTHVSTHDSVWGFLICDSNSSTKKYIIANSFKIRETTAGTNINK